MNRLDSSKKKYLNVVIALAVVAMLIGASIPLKKNERQTSLQEATEMISCSVLLSRQKAKAGDTTYRIQYDRGTFRVYRQESDGSWLLDPPDNAFVLPPDVQISTSSTPTDRWIVIDGEGAVDVKRSPVLLRLRDHDGNRLSIRISESGNVQEFPNW